MVKMKFADYVTLLNAASGFISILLSILGYPLYALGMIVLAFVFDSLDGVIARAMNQSSPLGKNLDSLSDVVSFGVAPAVWVSMMAPERVTVAAALIFLLSGIVRLAKFNTNRWQGFFVGVPIPTVAIVLPIVFLVQAYFDTSMLIYPVFLLGLAILMNANLRFKKPAI